MRTRQIQQRCPICEGHGLVPQGFYFYPAHQPFSATSISAERCKNCLGSGIVWTVETAPVQPSEGEGDTV